MQLVESQYLILLLALFLLTGEVVLFYLFFKFFKKINKALDNVDGKDIIKLLSEILKKSENTEKDIKAIFEENKKDRELLQTTLHKVGFVRFNPFGGMGGEQSFCIALLDANENGILITTIYGKDGARIYAKKIELGKSSQQLSKEEENAIAQALSS